MKMALLHDLVEIDAGDVFVFDLEAMKGKFDREMAAAHRLFALLPENGQHLKSLWLAFEAQECPESKFVGALDRFLPVLLNYENEGWGWRAHGIKKDQILTLNSKIEEGSAQLWEQAKAMIEDAGSRGWI